MAYVLAIYEVDRAYGGPEEGGWWYDTGELVRTIKVVANEDEAYRLARRAIGLLDHLQRRKRSVSSVLYSGGRHTVHVYKDVAPSRFPESTPHYE
jgi:hypothetical protein